MADSQQYKRFIELVHEGFDEESEDLEQAAQRFERIRACFLAGDPMQEDEREVEQAALALYKSNAEQSGGNVCAALLHEVDRNLSLLASFCRYKRQARRLRLAGNIGRAMRHEKHAEAEYQQLSGDYRW